MSDVLLHHHLETTVQDNLFRTALGNFRGPEIRTDLLHMISTPDFIRLPVYARLSHHRPIDWDTVTRRNICSSAHFLTTDRCEQWKLHGHTRGIESYDPTFNSHHMHTYPVSLTFHDNCLVTTSQDLQAIGIAPRDRKGLVVSGCSRFTQPRMTRNCCLTIIWPVSRV